MNFALIGASGYVAPKHMKAIKDVGGNLIAALDPNDSVGILDSYFPECRFFTEYEPFDWFCINNQIDYVSICSPNYLHKDHCRFALRVGADAICEKPLSLTTENLQKLKEASERYQKNIYTILQLRLNPLALELKKRIENKRPEAIIMTYLTPRGYWYDYSWKNIEEKSGGLATNIGVHLFDLVTWLLGRCTHVEVNIKTDRTVMGLLRFGATNVFFTLSNEIDLKPCRIIQIDNDEPIELSNGFKDLHTKSYQEILAGRGFGIDDTRESIAICEEIRNASNK